MVLGTNIVMIGDPFETLTGFYKGIETEKETIGKVAAEKIGKLAIHYAPYDEGDLVASIQWDDKSVWAGGSALEKARGRDYAWFVEYGTSRSPAQPYMRPALAEGVEYTSIQALNKIQVHWKGNSRVVPLSRAYAGIKMTSLFK
jgi:HK97 gp10 family phage protein